MTEVVTSEAAGKTEDTVVVQRLVSHELKNVWNVLMTDEGAEALLGPGAHLGDKGHTWVAEDGTRGVTRSFHPMEQIRFSWHADEAAPASIVDLHLRRVDDATTSLEVVHGHLDDGIDRDELTEHWSRALERIDHEAL